MKDFYSWITKVCSCIHAAFISGITCATGLSTAGECLCVCRGKRRCNSKRLSHLVWLLPFKRNVGLGIFFFLVRFHNSLTCHHPLCFYYQLTSSGCVWCWTDGRFSQRWEDWRAECWNQLLSSTGSQLCSEICVSKWKLLALWFLP